jgi:hypothetical protein
VTSTKVRVIDKANIKDANPITIIKAKIKSIVKIPLSEFKTESGF